MRDWLKDAFATSPGWAWSVVGGSVVGVLFSLPPKILAWFRPFVFLEDPQVKWVSIGGPNGNKISVLIKVKARKLTTGNRASLKIDGKQVAIENLGGFQGRILGEETFTFITSPSKEPDLGTHEFELTVTRFDGKTLKSKFWEATISKLK